MKDKVTVAIVFYGASLQCEISKYTSCDDVIKMATRKPVNGNEGFAVFESSFGVQKMLVPKTKLLKLVRSWGADKHNFHLEVKKVDKVKSKMASISRAKAKLRRLRSLVMKHEMKACQKFGEYLDNNLASNALNKDDKIYDKNITAFDETIQVEVIGKKTLLQRYLNDSMVNNVTRDEYSYTHFPVRTSGVGRENDSAIEPAFSNRTRGDGEEDEYYKIEAADERSMNNAFIVNDTTMCDIENSLLNDCILYDSEDIKSEDDEIEFEDDSDYDSICELERNVIESFDENTIANINELKNIFSNCDLNARLTEDELLESFMNTFVNDEESDEGMGSVHSDFD